MAGISLRMMVIALTRGVERKKLFPLFFFTFAIFLWEIPKEEEEKKLARNSNDEIRIDPV